MRYLPAHALLGFLVLLAAPLAATDYHVATTGNDLSGDGSAAKPWRSVTRGMLAAGAGDRILVEAGTYDSFHGESFPLVVKSGVTVLGSLTGITTIDGAGVFVPLMVVTDHTEPTVLQRLRFDGEVNIIEVFGNPVDLQVLDCVFLGGRKALNHSAAGGPAALTFDRNVVQGMDEDGLNWEASDAAASTHLLLIRDNRLQGKALSLHGVRVAASGEVAVQLDLSRNNIDKYGVGFAASVSASTSSASIDGLVAGNELLKCDDQGMLIQLTASGVAPSAATFGAVLRHNAATKNGKEGARLSLTASGSGNQAILDSDVYGNSFVDNDGSGFYLSDTEIGGGSCSAIPDLGGGGGSWGGNTFSLNDNRYSTGVEYDLRLESGDDVPALHNWWGSADPLLIETRIFHQVDDPSKGRVDFRRLRGGPLDFTVTPHRVRGDGGQRVTAVAGPGSVFVERAGVTPLSIVAGARLILDFQVTADGKRASFVLPGLRSEGLSAPLTITDPAGHSGAFELELAGDSQGGGFCFVATAAYGDYDAQEVRVLRRWRDQHLLSNPAGRAFVDAYYRWSPPLAAAIAERPWARGSSRALLAPVVLAVQLWMSARWVYLLAAGALAYRLLRRRRPRASG